MSGYGHEFRTGQRSGHLFIGAFLILLGSLFLLDSMNIVETGRLISRGWPLVLVAVGLGRLWHAKTVEARAGGAAWLFLGTVFFASRMGYLPFSVWGLLWPMALITFGLYLVVRSRRGFDVPRESANRMNIMAFMGGQERRITSQQFEGGEITAVMGGCTIDLREAAIEGDEAVIDVFVWAGGIELLVPEGWAIVGKV